MKIAVDALNLRNDERGMGRYVRRVLRDFAVRSDLSLTLLVRDPRDAEIERTLFGSTVAIADLASARKRRIYDAVWYPWNALRFTAHAPSLVTIADDFAFRFPARGFIARRREQAPIRAAVARATQLATISEWSRVEIAQRFKRDLSSIALVPLAPDPFFSPGLEPAPYAEKFVLAVGSGERRKNVPFLVDTLVRAFPEGDVRFVLVGRLEKRTRARLERARIPFTEETGIDDSRLRRLYRTTALTVVPSIAEGYGLVAAEALACGSSVLAAHGSALPEVVGDAGMLLDVQFADAWVDALSSIVRDPLLNATLRARAAARWTNADRSRTTQSIEDLLRALTD